MDESEGTSVNVTNDSEDSNIGEGLINCYGSPVGRIAVSHRSTGLPGTSREGSRVVSSIDFGNISKWVCNTHNFSNDFEQTCQCKNTCSRKSGKFRGCVCRDAGLRCAATCVCGSSAKPCRNNKESVPAANSPGNTATTQRPSSAFERHQLSLERERESIQVKRVP